LTPGEVTLNIDLLAFQGHRGIRIVTPKTFLQALRAPRQKGGPAPL
jgi:hypothetical protein